MELSEQERQALVETFLAETQEQLGQCEEALVALEQQPDDAEALQTIFRAAHTLKGNAASMGLSGVAELAHAVEDLLDRMRSQAVEASAGVVTLLLRSLDAIRRAVAAESEGAAEPPAARAALVAQLAAAGKEAARSTGAAAPGASPARSARRAGAQTLRVDVARLNRMLDLSGEMAVARGRLERMLLTAGASQQPALLEAHREAERVCLDLQEEILRVRMVPIEPVLRQQSRTLRDAARACGKLARLVVEGADVEVDTAIVEQLRGPLTHMVRNAVDHGIERAEERVARGKDARGTVTLRARHEGGGVVIELSDDGAGLDRARIAARARATGLAADPERLPDDELLGLIFEPGFSTASAVTEISGRGIGMDVVRRGVLALRGSIEATSRAGEGTAFAIRLPLTVAVIRGFLVEAAGETYVIPLDALVECALLPAEERSDARATGAASVRGHVVPYLRLRDAFALPGAPPERENLVVLRHQGRTAALAVDALLGEAHAVIKPLGTMLRDVRGIAGSTILGSGRPALILDVPALLRAATAAATRGASVRDILGPETRPAEVNGEIRC